MSKRNSNTRIYTVQVEDQIYRFARIGVEASSAAEAALIALRLAYDGKLEMQYQAHLREPAIYSVKGGNLPLTEGDNKSCLCDDVERLLELEGLDSRMKDEFEKYENDTDSTNYEQ